MKWIVIVVSHRIYRLRRCTVKVRAFRWTLRQLCKNTFLNELYPFVIRQEVLDFIVYIVQCSILDVSFCFKVNGEWYRFNDIFAYCSVLLPSRFLLPGKWMAWCHSINCFDIILSVFGVVKFVPVKSHLSNEMFAVLSKVYGRRSTENGQLLCFEFRAVCLYVIL